MKIMFISDIHGISDNLGKIREKYKEFKCEKLVILGDIYNNYNYYDNNKEKVQEFLNDFKDSLICVRGNCDSLTDLYDIPTHPIKELDLIKTNNLDIYITHGHIYNEDNWDRENTILIQGHTHRPKISKKDNNIYLNPGSISLPRGGNLPSYLVFNEKEFIIYDILDNIIYKTSL
ncbi:MAG: phosphodiesterase [Bacilli bacterium]|nr:phosphodiesterase [Bacilli bacterium]